ncbi:MULTISPECIES: hypothetical protein [Polaromonas]|uniref:Uncharacterized protein n=1 Tax=Polaromonas aquatica TaxID=332657 RepID=A0ABW1U0B8_9BURK
MLSNIKFPAGTMGLAFTVALAGCGGMQQGNAAAPAPATPVPVQAPAALQAAPVASPVRVTNAVAPVLAYADQIRALQGSELAQEITRLNDSPVPDEQLRLALALVQTRQLYDLARAQELLQKVLANSSGEARALHPLARLLAARFAEQRRIEDQLDRQGQQLRDAQRRLDQTNDKLEALKEIERSLTSKPGAPASAASHGRIRPATP